MEYFQKNTFYGLDPESVAKEKVAQIRAVKETGAIPKKGKTKGKGESKEKSKEQDGEKEKEKGKEMTRGGVVERGRGNSRGNIRGYRGQPQYIRGARPGVISGVPLGVLPRSP